MNNIKAAKNGYIAITVVIILLFVIITMGVVSSFGSLNQIQTSYSGIQSMEAFSRVESCADEALYQLNITGNLPNSVIILNYSCTITVESQAGSEWTFLISHTNLGYTKTVRLTASRSDRVYVTQWEEI